jgi:hypothetical protein
LKRAWTRFLASGSVSLVTAAAIAGQSAQPSAKLAATHPPRENELTLAGLRPGRDTLRRAKQLYSKGQKVDSSDATTTFLEWCQDVKLIVENDATGRIQTIRVLGGPGHPTIDCLPGVNPVPSWITGHRVGLGDLTSAVLKTYGKPDSRSPSTRAGQQLELWYYAFDWAGPDVPQVMQVLCTPEKDGRPGRVVEITLAASSL